THAQGDRDRMGIGTRDPRGLHVDTDRQREHARGQREARLRHARHLDQRAAEVAAVKDWFAGDVAARYDSDTADMAVEPVVDFLLPLAGGGALELAIGTGRIAVPLAQRGVRVAGIDLSADMVAELRKKTDAIPVAIGDYATTRVEGEFSLAYIVFNSISNQTTQEGQVATFANAAAHLGQGGCFVVEVGTKNRRALEVFDLSDTHVGIDEYEADTQRL